MSDLQKSISALVLAITERRFPIEGYEPEAFETFHQSLLSSVYLFACDKFGNEATWSKLFMLRMLLNDVDVSLKFFIHFLLNLSTDFSAFDFYFLHAAIVSDTRVSAITDLLHAWKNQDYDKGVVLSDKDLDQAYEGIRIKNVVLLNTSGSLSGLPEKLPKSEQDKCFMYYICRDFLVDYQTLKKLRYNFLYIVFEPSLKQADYNKILETCVRNAITPLFILYIADQGLLVSKEMFKHRWIVTLSYCYSLDDVVTCMNQRENSINRDLMQYSKYYDDFESSIKDLGVPPKMQLEDSEDQEGGEGWEVLEAVDNSVFNHLVEELSLGTKLIGSLHYYVLTAFREARKQKAYWKYYAHLFGISPKYTTILDVNCSKTMLRAYTLQTEPPFYKMLNDAFRSGNKKEIAKYRAFYSMLQDMVRKGILKKHIGFVYRGTFFATDRLHSLKLGSIILSSCFTSTSKNQTIAREFARKAKRNVLLEIELDPAANSNVDIHAEEVSRYPEEEEV